ncbi:MAG: hypothetical protein A3K67_03080 [Euryarchaeota archaeon RBG_16_62_10]|nr:MAG: hypothetical protein A3K67_03080 [Euryarchaeota archaeon RBG_16_62_10]
MQMRSLRIGNTPMRRAQKLEKRLEVRRLHLKLEGENPSGTHKDRAALMHALNARKRGKKALAAASCGNYGAALAYVCDKLNLGCHIHVPAEFVAPRRTEIVRRGAEITDVDGDYEDAFRRSAEDAAANGWYDANPGGPDKELDLYAYSFIAREIAQALGRQPDWVSVPVGNGTCISGIWQGFRSMSMKPRMLGVSNNNSAVRGMVLKAKAPVDLPRVDVTEVNEALCGNFLTDGAEAVSAMLESNGTGVEVPDSELVKAAEVIRKDEGIDVFPASAGAVWGIRSLESRNHVFVAVITGRGNLG